jgi:hypothetical protein
MTKGVFMSNYRYFTDAAGNQFESYEAACAYYGADTPAQIEAEYAYYDQLAQNESLDAMEARGGPAYYFDEGVPF